MAALIVVVGLTVAGATKGYDGTEPGFWGAFSVIYAEVEQGGGTGNCEALLRPKYTISGNFDVGQEPRMRVNYLVSNGWGSIVSEPMRDGQRVVIVVERAGYRDYRIPPSCLFAFMPEGMPFLVVEDSEDERIDTIRDKIHRRLHPAKVAEQ